jgi:CheY-like chemotaxis protein
MEISPSLAGVCVLVISEEVELRELATMVLTGCQATVTSAASIPEAFTALAQQSFQVLIADIDPPQQIGYELISEIRKRERDQGASERLPAAAAVTGAQTEDRIRLLLAGYQLHLPKPIETSELAWVVAALADWNGGANRETRVSSDGSPTVPTDNPER